MVYYITIEKDMTESRVLSLIKIQTGYEWKKFIITEPPSSLMGNKKILTIRLRTNWLNTIVKIDGPGFIIENLYLQFWENK